MSAPTADESRALLEPTEAAHPVIVLRLRSHLRAALDREAAALNGESALRRRARFAEAERDAARAEAERLRAALQINAEWWAGADMEAVEVKRATRAALASEPDA